MSVARTAENRLLRIAVMPSPEDEVVAGHLSICRPRSMINFIAIPIPEMLN